MGQVTPLFLKEDKLYADNYRPVTVLSILSNIYERVLPDQLSVYFKDILSDFIFFFTSQELMRREHTAASNRRLEDSLR